MSPTAAPSGLERWPARPKWSACARGKHVALDLTYSVIASPEPPPRLADLRADLIERYPQVGPIFA